MKNITRVLKSLICIVSLFFSATAMAAPDTVYLVRHAEKMTGTGDVLLSEAGEARSEWLAAYFADKGLTRAFSSPYNRTMGTTEIIVQSLGIEVEAYDPRTLSEFAEAVKNMSGVILVVGHSNTTPYMAEFLGGEPGSPIEEGEEYDRIYKIDFASDGSVKTEMHYSEPRFSGRHTTGK